MNNDSSLSHSRWECKYHVVWIPKYRRKTLYGELRRYLGQIFKDLWEQRDKNQPKSPFKNQPLLMTGTPVRVRFKPDSKRSCVKT